MISIHARNLELRQGSWLSAGIGTVINITAYKLEINTAVAPRGLNNLPQQATETEVAQICQANNSQTTLEFFDIGRGGLPPTPEDLLNSEVIIAEWMPLNLETTLELPTKSIPEAINKVTLFNSLPCR